MNINLVFYKTNTKFMKRDAVDLIYDTNANYPQFEPHQMNFTNKKED